MPTKMDATSLGILTNSNFDYSKLTWEDMIEMGTFWAWRIGDPIEALRVWIELLEENAPNLFRRMYSAILNVGFSSNEDAEIFDSIFEARRGKSFRNIVGKIAVPIDNFDIDAARKAHGNWPKIKP